jgi:hypothetical protein
MLEPVFLPINERSSTLHMAALTPLAITSRVDFDGTDGAPGWRIK